MNDDIKPLDLTIEKTEVEAKVRTLKEPKEPKEPEPDKTFDEYYDTHMVPFRKFNSIGWKSIKVLEFLNDKQWDDVALAYVHALRPSSIRVTEGTTKLDARVWRVTVYINEDNTIRYISQEVEVGLPENVAHGEALSYALSHGIDSPQCKWYNGEHGGYILCPDGYFKHTKDGLVKFPEDDDPFDEAGKVI